MGTKNVEEKQKKKNQRKKRIFTFFFCIIGILLMLIAGFFGGKLIYKLMDEKGTLNEVDINAINNGIGEFLHHEENSTNGNEDNTVPVPEPTTVPTFAPTVAPNTVQTDPTYFIKVNYGANVVTIYMKDSSRRIYNPS